MCELNLPGLSPSIQFGPNCLGLPIYCDCGSILEFGAFFAVFAVQKCSGCAKDCKEQKGNVWLEFGTGKVDFPAVFGELKKVGFNGPVMVECCAAGDMQETVTANARKNREYLKKVFAAL